MLRTSFGTARSVATLAAIVCSVASIGGCKRFLSEAGGAAGSASHALASRSAMAPSEAPAPPDNAFVANFSRQQQVLGAFQHTDAVRSCWQSALMRDPAHPAEAVRVQLTVDATGHAQVGVSGTSDPALGNCIRLRASGRSYGVGGEIATEAVFNLAPGT